MKKLLSFFTTIIFALLIISCDITVQDQDYLDKPDVEESSSGLFVSIPRFSKETRYINLYRKDVTQSTEQEATVVNIGLIFPSSYSADTKTFAYEDLNVRANHKYQYMARYCEPDNYYYTFWSDEKTLPVTKGFSDAIITKYITSGAEFIFNPEEKTLTVNGLITPPNLPNYDTDWVPVLAVKSAEATQVFTIESLADQAVINLSSVLSPDFYNTDITIIGLLGQKTIMTESASASTNKEKIIMWTESTPIKIRGYSAGVIKITSDSGSTGYDFS